MAILAGDLCIDHGFGRRHDLSTFLSFSHCFRLGFPSGGEVALTLIIDKPVIHHA
jgi:hypothetical protein